MSTQDNLASQEKIVVNGRHSLCGHRKVNLCVIKEIGVQIQHCLIGVHIGFCVLVCVCVKSFFWLRKLLFE